MRLIRLSVTDIDAFLSWREREEEGVDVLRRRLLRLDPPSPQMEMGTAFHGVLQSLREDPPSGSGVSLFCDDRWTFAFECDVELPAGHMNEVPFRKEYEISGYRVLLRGRVDALYDGCVVDYKLVSRIDIDRFVRSFQWRAYLDMSGAWRFRWEIFRQVERDGVVRIVEHRRLEQHAHPRLRDDVLSVLSFCVPAIADVVPEFVDGGGRKVG